MRSIMGHRGFILAAVVATLTAFGAVSSFGQDTSFATKGVWEAGGMVSVSNYTAVSNGESGDGITIFTFAPRLGYFVANGLELSLGTGVALLPGVTSISPEDGESLTLTQLFLAPSYNFRTSGGKTFPFLEGMVGYTSMSSGDDGVSGLSYGAKGGVKIAVVDHVLLTLAGEYIWITLNDEGADERNGFNYLNFGVGISGYF